MFVCLFLSFVLFIRLIYLFSILKLNVQKRKFYKEERNQNHFRVDTKKESFIRKKETKTILKELTKKTMVTNYIFRKILVTV